MSEAIELPPLPPGHFWRIRPAHTYPYKIEVRRRFALGSRRVNWTVTSGSREDVLRWARILARETFDRIPFGDYEPGAEA